MNKPDSSIIVVGAGVFGAAAAWELALRGHPVQLIDPGPLPHPEASSTDISKVIRMDYGADQFYARMAERALEGWDAWNRSTDPPLYHQDGFLILAGEAMAPGGFEHDSHATLASMGHPVERLANGSVEARFPGWSGTLYPDGYLSHRAGWAESGNVVSWMLAQAQRAGVEVLDGEAMVELVEVGSRVTGVRTASNRVISADVVVVAAGAWTPFLLPWLDGILTCVGQPVFHFLPSDPSPFAPDRFPPWAADMGRTGWYGFPAQPDGRVKVANHGAGIAVDPRQEKLVPPEWEGRFRAFLSAARPDLADAPVIKTRLCLYSDTFDGDFLIDHDPERNGLVVASGGSGHGFKFAPVLGSLIADVVEGKANPWAERFRWRALGVHRREAARADAR